MESILTSIKKMVGIDEECEDFDIDLIIHINSVFPILTQLGVGPSEGFSIEDKTATWDDFISTNENLFNSVKTYIYLKVRLVFDPPQSSALIEVINKNILELEWRLNVAAENASEEGS